MYYVAFGSNLHPGRLRDRVPSARPAGNTVLSGWRLHWHKRSRDGSGKCNIVPSPGGVVYVAVYELERAQLARLDEFEGLGNGYDHHELELPGFGAAVTYHAAATHIDETLRPYEWYKAYVLLGCEHHGFDGGYIESIRELPHCADPDRRRHDRHMARIETLRRAGLPAD